MLHISYLNGAPSISICIEGHDEHILIKHLSNITISFSLCSPSPPLQSPFTAAMALGHTNHSACVALNGA